MILNTEVIIVSEKNYFKFSFKKRSLLPRLVNLASLYPRIPQIHTQGVTADQVKQIWWRRERRGGEMSFLGRNFGREECKTC